MDAEPVGDQEEPVLVAGLRFADVDEPSSGPSSACVPIEKVPIFALSGQCAGPSVPKLASASVQARWPSAASGLIVKPSGRVTAAERISDGEVGEAEELGGAQLEVEAGRRVGLGRRRARVEDRFEDLMSQSVVAG